MINSIELDDANVRVLICYTDALKFDDLKNLAFLSERDIKKVSRFVREKDRVSHVVSEYFKRKYVGEWNVNSFGKPFSSKVFFNISHCEEAVVIALSNNDVGIDVENIRPVDDPLVKYVCDEKELALVNSNEDFFSLWTAKESLAKAQGEGLKKNLKKIPAFPIVGQKEYLGEKFFSKQLKEGNLVITVVRKGEKPFNIDIDKEELK